MSVNSSNSSLLQGIKSRIGNLVNLGFSSSTDLSDLYEAYIFSILIRAAKNEGANISFQNPLEQEVQSLIFRRSPGQIYVTTQPYTHAVIEFDNKPVLEAHVGIMIQGRSQVAHECDLSVILQEEARNCRNLVYEPRHTKVIIAVECKHYTSNLQLHLGRSFIGLASDLNVKEDIYFISNRTSDNIEKLLSSHRKKWEHNIIPRQVNEIQRLMYTFQRNFKDFKARYN
ncbi:hypothetical protein H6G06_23640 [Anabaena sphaerica FACHB-251]|uniref:Uncharacterized protein n=1 Tax=Anabaena sphaerica FACHB-251 TaxID=2692883 RepID=A0A927A3E4_9NOST|nr:hypothetical protein [Anabaena sphaerica]MBD2296393.1 hypothetical protein [Anabaena sphaerica FACHB-251]